MGVSVWRAVGLVALLAIAMLVLTTILAGLALVLVALTAVLVGLMAVAALHVIYVPRWSRLLGIPPPVLGGLLLPLFVLVGWALAGEPVGVLGGLLLWLGVVVVPRLAFFALIRRLGWGARQRRLYAVTAWPRTSRYPAALPGLACPQCGLVQFPVTERSAAACLRCGTPLPRSIPVAHDRSR
jgi:hypothetical protein